MPDPRPNILLITIDQQRGDCLSLDSHGPSCLQTPNLDWVARTGTHFHRGYSECPSCIPARRVLMTGAAPAANGAVGFKSTQWHPPHTLAGELSRAGYQTEMIGKLHLTPIRKCYSFDHMQLADATRGDHNDYVEWLQQYHQRNEVHPGMAHGISSNGWIGRPRTTCPKNRCIPFGVLIERWTSCENAIRPSRFSSTFPLLTSTRPSRHRRPTTIVISTGTCPIPSSATGHPNLMAPEGA